MAYDASSRKGITEIMVRGFKSLYDESRIEVRPLTILAGANSSGKSSIMQPLLLLKQTLEAPYDPGPLLLNGPILRFTFADQLMSNITVHPPAVSFTCGFQLDGTDSVVDTFQKLPDTDLVLLGMVATRGPYRFTLPGGPSDLFEWLEFDPRFSPNSEEDEARGIYGVARERCFLEYKFSYVKEQGDGSLIQRQFYTSDITLPFVQALLGMIYVPGLRGNPERTYRKTAVGPLFPSTFETYVASVVNAWQIVNSPLMDTLSVELATLGLTKKIQTRPISDAEIELLVGRLPPREGSVVNPLDQGAMVSIADVGFGVSQILPVLVALLAAEPGQLVYLEQPEIHLHPRAQVALAEVLSEAAQRGVRVVAETHSSLLLLGIQTLVAEGKLDPELVKLHWFKRDEQTGVTKIASADLDEQGAFGEWPEDFADVELAANNRYLNAAELPVVVTP